MTYTTGLNASKALKEAGIEVETEKYWKPDGGWHLSERKGKFTIAAPSLSELSEVFRMLGEKKGWDDIVTKFFYLNLYLEWFNSQSQERCDEFIINLLQQ